VPFPREGICELPWENVGKEGTGQNGSFTKIGRMAVVEDSLIACIIILKALLRNSDVIYILSAPFLTPAKKLSQPRPITARINMAMIIHVRIAITQSYYSLYLT
jgi:hypothetical protein